MTSPIAAFKTAVQQWLLEDASLIALLREPKIFADPPRHVAYPLVAFTSAVARENGTSSEDGHVIELVLGIWSRYLGSDESLKIAAAIEHRLATIPATLNAHRLVNLIVRSIEPTRLRDGETWRTDVRIKAVTEVV